MTTKQWGDFTHDKEKMKDFYILSKRDFLKSYSYLNEEEYKNTINKRLEYLRGEIEKACISTAEIAELESLKEYIEPGDTVLLEWAGVQEFAEKKQEHFIIFEYYNEDGKYTEWFWTTKTERAEIIKECYEWISEANDFTEKESREHFTVSDFWRVEDAVKLV